MMVNHKVNVSRKLSLCTYNCRHYTDQKVPYIQSLFAKCDFVLLQEHCLYKSNLQKLCNINQKFGFVGTSAMDENKILSGRPHGGCCIVWNTGIKMKVTSVPCESDRLCAVLMTQESGITILICNVYMPCDQRREGDNLELFNDILCEISILRQKVNALFFVLGGRYEYGF